MSWVVWLVLWAAVVWLFIRGLSRGRPARDADLHGRGRLYVRSALRQAKDGPAEAERLWAEYERGMTLDPTAFEDGMRLELDAWCDGDPAGRCCTGDCDQGRRCPARE
ncbi:hypothetical protein DONNERLITTCHEN_00660 [Janthinobacterium phage vB_JliS-Donnerlittchen]|uniref:Uncharacterized protein n=1 Tax=Janthinobacterium phage vB_JliS-Donnerlittchen TaxID=2948610 RepID=A0A9E7MRN1_9CAUD|nr:hypothetical protein P9A49_gp70 [Janthinobacterium phage vB_JliM-Donnerlittchen]USN14466.1 hypothetical protein DONNERLITTCHEN_00660 [Janthinobacterium phage vB_JliM-Donnerlittchen]